MEEETVDALLTRAIQMGEGVSDLPLCYRRCRARAHQCLQTDRPVCDSDSQAAITSSHGWL